MIIIENGTVQDLQKLMGAQDRADRLQAELLALREKFDRDGVALMRLQQQYDDLDEAWTGNLKVLADTINEKNDAYAERNKVVAALAHVCFGALGHPTKVTDDQTQEEGWRTVLFIQLPTGQVSWHFHDSERELLKNLPHDPEGLFYTVDHPTVWDGHTTEEKYARLLKWCMTDTAGRKP